MDGAFWGTAVQMWMEPWARMKRIRISPGVEGLTFYEGRILEKRSGICYNGGVLWYPVERRLFSCASFLPKAVMSNRKDKTFQVTTLENEYSGIRSIGCFKEKRHGA